MSLAIQCDNVIGVLLADGWYNVGKNSFGIDAYEYLWDKICLHGGGDGGVCSSGFHFWGYKEGNPKVKLSMMGPLTSILAVSYDASKKVEQNND